MTATLEQHGGWRRIPWRMVLWAIPTALLITPAIMMQVSNGWLWGPFDFAFAALLLYGATGTVDLAIRKGGNLAYRFGAGLAVLASFLLVWINAAVGMIGESDNPANLMFIGVILIAAAGSVMARFEPRGMARAMGAAALAQTLIVALVLLNGWGIEDPPGTNGLAMLVGAFVVLWGLSAALFGWATRERFQ